MIFVSSLLFTIQAFECSVCYDNSSDKKVGKSSILSYVFNYDDPNDSWLASSVG